MATAARRGIEYQQFDPKSPLSYAGRLPYARLRRRYGRARWRKKKGYALVRLASGYIVEAELHWYEASGIGRREIKIKRLFQGWP